MYCKLVITIFLILVFTLKEEILGLQLFFNREIILRMIDFFEAGMEYHDLSEHQALSSFYPDYSPDGEKQIRL
jgi:hypothetical protein